jgi:hypothetical protein
MTDQRHTLLTQFAGALDTAAKRGALTGDPNKPISIKEIGVIAGPRAGALEISAGLDAGRLLRVLQADDGAIVRQFIPWAFPLAPAVYLSGQYVRIEAGWPDELAERAIKVTDLNRRPHGSGRWLAGVNELGRTVTMGLSDNAPHFLIAGTTGSGKSVALRSMITQLGRGGDQLILIDGKYGEGLRGLDHLPNVIGPLAIDLDAARGALAWATGEMQRRYEQADQTSARIVVVIDEVQEFSSDPAVVEMIRRVAAQGRAARVSIVLATQHPTIEAFGDATVKRNVTGRIALRVSDAKASEVAIGQSTPRADWLLGAGDAFACVPGAIQRVQIAYMERREIERALTAMPKISEWPVFVAEALPNPTNAATYTGAELAVSLVNAHNGSGRPALVKALDDAGLGKPGSVRAERLLKLGREQLEALRADGWSLCETD